jgi:hypothetical protein
MSGFVIGCLLICLVIELWFWVLDFAFAFLSTRLLSGVLLSWNKAWAFLQLLQWVWAGLQFRVFVPCWKIDIWFIWVISFCLCISFTIVVFSWNKSLSGLFHFCFELIFWFLRALICPQVSQSCPVIMLLLMKSWKTVSCSYNPCTCSLFLFLHHVLKTGRSIVSR